MNRAGCTLRRTVDSLFRSSDEPIQPDPPPGHRWLPFWLWILQLGLVSGGCGRIPHSDRSDFVVMPGPPSPSAGPGGASGFEGVAQLSPLADGFDASWNPVRDDQGLASEDYTYRVYVSFNGADLDYSAPPFLVTPPGAAGATLSGLTSGTRVSVAVQPDSLVDASDLDRNEVRLDGVVAPLWYVNDGASPGGDGRTGSSAFTTIAQAIQAVIDSAEIGIILIAAGDYEEQLILPGDVHLYGSYDALFSMRDRQNHPSTLRPTVAGSTAIQIAVMAPPTFVDGLDIDGGGQVGRAVNVKNADLQWSNSDIFNLANEGLQCSSKDRLSLLRVRKVRITACATEGLEATGSLDAELTSCTFRENGEEGAEFDNLAVQPSGQSHLWVRDCNFDHNGNDGLDVDLNELFPTIGGSSLGGRIEVLVERSSAMDNAKRGLLIDIDFQDVDEISTGVLLRGNTVSRQGLDGLRVDADATGLFVLVGNRSSANGLRGLSAGGASSSAAVIVSNHWELGSAGEGVGVIGPVPTILSHTAVTGSRGVSILGNDSTLLVNGAFWLCSAPTSVDTTFSYSDPALPGIGNFQGAPEVRLAPLQFFLLDVAGADRDRFSLPVGESLFEGDFFELGDDAVVRQVARVQAGEVTFSPPASAPPAAGTLVARFSGPDVVEDPRLIPGSRWQDAGDPLDRDGDATVPDVGVLGGSLESFLPLRSGEWIPFVVARLTPAPGPAAGPFSQIRVGFTRTLDKTTVSDSTFRVLLDDEDVAGTLNVILEQIVFDADSPLSGGRVEVQVYGGLRSSRGEDLLLPIRYRIQVP